MKYDDEQLKQIRAATAKHEVLLYFFVNETHNVSVTETNHKHYKHLGATPGNQVTIKKLRSYADLNDLNHVYNARLNEKKNNVLDTTEEFFIIDELTRVEKWITCIKEVDPDFMYMNVLRHYAKLLNYKLDALIKSSVDQGNQSMAKPLQIIKLQKPKHEQIIITHRMEVLVNLYKFAANLEPMKTYSKLMKDGGKGRYDAFLSLTRKKYNKHNPYRVPTTDEIKEVIKLLDGYPEAQTIAETELKNAEAELRTKV